MRQEESEFNAEFTARLLLKLDWEALRKTASEVGPAMIFYDKLSAGIYTFPFHLPHFAAGHCGAASSKAGEAGGGRVVFEERPRFDHRCG